MNRKNLLTVVVLGFCFLGIIFLTGTEALAKSKNLKNLLKIPGAGHLQILHLKNGTYIKGRIVEIGKTAIKFRGEAEEVKEITVLIRNIERIEEVPVDIMKKEKFWYPNSNPTRLFLAPTGCMLKKGEAILNNHYLVFPGISYGVSDRVSIGGGTPIFAPLMISYFTAKMAINTGAKMNTAVGCTLACLPRLFEETGPRFVMLGGLYVVGTFGTPDTNFTVGLFGGGSIKEIIDESYFLISAMIGGEKRLSRRLYFITENWIVRGVDQPIISYGLRFLGKRLSVDFALYNTIGRRILFPGIPYLNFVYRL